MRRAWPILAALAALAAPLAAPGAAAAAPLYEVRAAWGDTHLPPGGAAQLVVQARNIGDATGKEDLILEARLPAGVSATEALWRGAGSFDELCQIVSAPPAPDLVSCKAPGALLSQIAPPPGPAAKSGDASDLAPGPSGFLPILFVEAQVDPGAAGGGESEVRLYGGGATLPDGQPCAKEPSLSPPLLPCAADEEAVPFDPAPSPFGILPGTFAADLFDAAHPLGEPLRQAGAHPHELRLGFELNAKTGIASDATRFTVSSGQLRTVEVTMPRGFVGNPEATPKCNSVRFAQAGATLSSTACPPETQVGYLNGLIAFPATRHGRGMFAIPNALGQRVALYNLEPPRGVAADFGFTAGGLVQGHVYAVPDPAQNYAIKTVTPNISATLGVSVRGGDVTVWGVPADPAHDRFRAFSEASEGRALGAPWGSAAIRPFLSAPMDCGQDNGGARMRADSYAQPGAFTPTVENPAPLDVEGCEDARIKFEPEISLQPTDRGAGAPTGLDVHLEVPQRNDEVSDATKLYHQSKAPAAIPTPPMKKAVVTFPEGMTISPSAAQGLGSCSSEQIGLGTDRPVTCPDASQYGTLTLHTPILPVDEQPEGFIYVAKQGDNPFHNFLSLYLVIQEPDRGILVKIPGKVDLDPVTGQITTSFDDLPQVPVDDFQMSFNGGVRAALVNPTTCGTKTIRAEFFSWHDPQTPHPVESSYEVTQRPDGSPCPNSLAERPFTPAFDAGTESSIAGTYSPFSLELSRTDDDQEFSQLGVAMPQGLIGKLAGVSECPEAGIAQAIARTGAGEGALEQAAPSCPASSLIGTTQVGAGVGVPLIYVPGKVYLAGPYRGAPLSVLVITPAVVGPYDLGVIAVRTALSVDPETTRVSASSDPFPLIYQGIPVRIRDIRLLLDRDRFILNPTSCAEKQIEARLTGTGGEMASTVDDTAVDLTTRFQAAECASLGFEPRLSFRLFGATHRGAHPRLRAVLRMPKGGANIARASVALPRSEFLDQGHIRTVCTRVQFAAERCPKGSIYGHVRAKTPLLDEVVSGPIYLRSSEHLLPDLIAVFKGRVDAHVVGRIDSVRGGIRNTFELVPDIPVRWAVFDFQGGRKGLLINSRDICQGRRPRVSAVLHAQNGRRASLRPRLKAPCAKRRGARRERHGR